MQVIKINGEKEDFSYKKVLDSALRAGTTKRDAKDIADYVQSIAYDEMQTTEIYKIVKNRLERKHSIRFSLKNTMKKLGEDGFYFEKYLGRILDELGYKVKMNQHLKGESKIRYEIDFLAQKDNIVYLGECKYKWKSMDKIDLKTVLYNYARFLDIKENTKKNVFPMIVTNYKLTELAMKYCLFKDVIVLSWNFPKNNSLGKIIEENKLYPINILPSYNKIYSPIFKDLDIILVRDFIKKKDKINISKQKLDKMIYEAEILLNI